VFLQRNYGGQSPPKDFNSRKQLETVASVSNSGQLGLVLSSNFGRLRRFFWAVLFTAFFVPFWVALPVFLAAFFVSRPASSASCLVRVAVQF
jgi:hypothetical protein